MGLDAAEREEIPPRSCRAGAACLGATWEWSELNTDAEEHLGPPLPAKLLVKQMAAG